MDAPRFDALARALSPNTRRGLLGVLLTLPVLGGLLAVLGAEDVDAKKRGRKKRKKKKCKKQRRTICNGKCGTVKDKCKKKINCGSCACEDLLPTDDLQAAVDATPAGGTLRLCAGTWELPSTVSISQDLTLRGVGAELTILQGQGADRVLRIGVGAAVTMQDLTVTGGAGGIDNSGQLTVRDVTVTGNTTSEIGGGILNVAGTLTLEDGSRVAGNAASRGGGIYNTGTVILKAGSVVGGDTPADANTATDFGGGILNFGGSSRLTLESGSRVAGNTAESGGGITSGGTVTVQANALVCDNRPPNNQCAGIGMFNGNCPNPESGTCPA